MTNGPYREMACFLCGCSWTVIGEAMSTRPPCPECGGCLRQGLHLGEVYRRALEGHSGDAASGPVTGAMFMREGKCPEDALCTTAARDTIGMSYDERVLLSAGYRPDWHDLAGRP